MEQLIKTVTEKAGISEAQAKTAVESVLTFLKDKMPAGIGSQVESFVKGGGTNESNGSPGSAFGSITGKLKGTSGL
jgi:hypothetical protein